MLFINNMSNFGIRCGAKAKSPPCNEAFVLPGSGLSQTLAQTLQTGNTTADIFVPGGRSIVISTNNRIFLSAGTQAAPSLTFNGDNATGLYRAAGLFGITAPGVSGIDMDAGTAGFDIDSTGQFNVSSTLAAANAIRIGADNVDGGINFIAGTTGINTTGVTGQINWVTSQAAASAILMDASDAAGGIRMISGTGGLDVDSTGTININSALSAANAIVIDASGVAGELVLGAGTGGLDIDTTGGFNVSTTLGAANAIRLGATGAGGGVTFIDGGAGITSNGIVGRINFGSAQASASAILLGALDAAGGVTINTGTDITTGLTLGDGVKLIADSAGGNAIVGTATLVAGTVTVATTAVTANSRIQVTRADTGGTLGFLNVPVAALVVGVSFDVDSDNAMDTSGVNWFIIN